MKLMQLYLVLLYRFYKSQKFRVSLMLLILTFLGSCRKWVEVSVPDSSLSTGNVFSTDAGAEAAVAGIYSSFWDKGYSLSVDGGLSAEEFRDYSQTSAMSQLYANQLLSSNQEVFNLWQTLYATIYQCNAVVTGLDGSREISTPLKVQLLGEALTWRAFLFDYLTSFWGPVPLILSPDYKQNATAARTPVDSIIPRLLADLRVAEPGLPEDYSGGERIRIIKWANLAVQARLNARVGNWRLVDSLTTAILAQNIYQLCINPDSVFLKNSLEAVWQIQPQQPGQSTEEGSQFILLAAPTAVALTDSLVTAFDSGDIRKAAWVGSIEESGTTYFFPFKYKDKERVDPLNEYGMVIRLAEIYLLRAEARANLGMIETGYDDLNRIRARAKLTPLNGTTASGLLTAITSERRLELFSEWADRWIFLKRTAQATNVLRQVKSGWQDSDTLYPIPKSEVQSDNFLTQNPGY